MFKNKERKYTCSRCSHRELNFYYGIKAYDDIPLYQINEYYLGEKNCAWCGHTYYFLTRKR